MKSILWALVFVCQTAVSQIIPEGYLLQYQQNFSGSKVLGDFKVENPNNWGIFKSSGNFYLQCSSADTVATFPSNIAFLNNRIFGDFILEANVMPQKDSNGIAEICVFLGMRDFSRYYYVHLSNRTDTLSHGIFLVKNSANTKLTGDSALNVAWNENKWHKVRLERNIVRRTIIVYFDDMTIPILKVKDYELVMGSVGVGTYTGPARFDNLTIWSPTVISE